MATVKQMIRNAGGEGKPIEVVPPKLDCFDQVLSGECDSTWIFMNWEGVMAKQKGIELNVFPLEASNIPPRYSPVILISNDLYVSGNDIINRFLEVTKNGFKAAAENPIQAAKHLLEGSKNHSTLVALGLDFLIQSQEYLSTSGCMFDNQGRWGIMELTRWDAFVNFLVENQCIQARDGSFVTREAIDCNKLFDNKFLV